MIPQKFGQLFLFLDFRFLMFLFALTILAPPSPFPPVISLAISFIPIIIHSILLHALTLNLSLLQLIPTVVHAEHSAQNSRSAQVIHSQIAAPLILIFQKCEPSALAGFLVAREIQVHRIAVLREDSQDVAFAELKW